MTWVRLDDQFADSPKMEAAGPLAAWLHVAALCYASQHLTDGLIPKSKVARLADVTAPAKRARALVDVGAWHEPGHACERCQACPPGHYLIHDYLDYQPSRADVEAQREKDREKKRRQRSKGTAQAGRDDTTGRFTPGESPPMSPGDTPRDPPQDAPGESPATRPDPTPTEELTSSNGFTTPAPDPDDDHQPTAAPDPTRDERQRAGTAIALLARRDLDDLPPDRRVGDPNAWLRTAHDRRHAAHGPQLLELARQHPDADPDQLATLADPPPAERPTPRRRPDDIAPEHQRAARRRAEDGIAHVRAITELPVPPDAADRLHAIRQAHRLPGA